MQQSLAKVVEPTHTSLKSFTQLSVNIRLSNPSAWMNKILRRTDSMMYAEMLLKINHRWSLVSRVKARAADSAAHAKAGHVTFPGMGRCLQAVVYEQVCRNTSFGEEGDFNHCGSLQEIKSHPHDNIDSSSFQNLEIPTFLNNSKTWTFLTLCWRMLLLMCVRKWIKFYPFVLKLSSFHLWL